MKKFTLFTFLLGVLMLNTSTTKAQTFSEIIKAVASDRASEDYFGYSVAISGDYAIVGAYYEDEDAAGANTASWAGSAYIFKRGGVDVPVELTYFKGQATTAGTLLQWQTATEKNNEGFAIQRSSDGENWEVLDFVIGAGTSIEAQEYTFVDEAPLFGVNYYRLKQMDYDNQFDYSHLVSVEYGKSDKAETLAIFPNPVTNRLNIVDAVGQATIYNMLGQPVKRFTISNETSSIDVVDLPKGQYILRIQQQNGNMVTKQFVK